MLTGPRSSSDRAIVIKTINYGESHRIFTLLTLNHGKISTFASHARKSKKRFGPSLDLFCELDAQFSPNHEKNSGLWKLNQTHMLSLNLEIRRDFRKLATASYLSECLFRLLPEGETQEDIYHWFSKALKHMTANEIGPREALMFDYELLAFCGYQPQFISCGFCRKSLEEKFSFFSYETGSAYCKGCRPQNQGTWFYPKINFDQALTPGYFSKISSRDLRQTFSIMQDFVAVTLGSRPKSQALRWEAFYGFK